MIPQTVPNSPMNGVMLAVVARNGTRFSSLFTSTTDARISARSTAVRLLRVGRAAAAGGLARRRHRRSDLPQLGGELGVAGLEQADERAVAERAADGLHLGELVAAAEHVEKARRLARRSAGTPRTCRG